MISESALSRRPTRDIPPSYESMPLNGIGAKHFTSVRAQVGMGLLCVDLYLTTLPYRSHLASSSLQPPRQPPPSPTLTWFMRFWKRLLHRRAYLVCLSLSLSHFLSLYFSLFLSLPAHLSRPRPFFPFCPRNVDSWLVFPQAHVHALSHVERSKWNSRFVHFRPFVCAFAKSEDLFHTCVSRYVSRTAF